MEEEGCLFTTKPVSDAVHFRAPIRLLDFASPATEVGSHSMPTKLGRKIRPNVRRVRSSGIHLNGTDHVEFWPRHHRVCDCLGLSNIGKQTLSAMPHVTRKILTSMQRVHCTTCRPGRGPSNGTKLCTEQSS